MHALAARTRTRWATTTLLVLTVGLAGCTDPSGAAFVDRTGSTEIAPGESLEFDLTSEGTFQLTYSVNVTDGPNIDVFVMNSTERAAYQQGEPFSFVGDCSQQDARQLSGTCQLPAGTFYLVIDHTSAGQAGPDPLLGQPAAISYEVHAKASAATRN